ncbi:hypothetical protein A2U01_0108294, partial [Trifolium medium]|nr:hypothetical protein [Trifolium medium]
MILPIRWHLSEKVLSEKFVGDPH